MEEFIGNFLHQTLLGLDTESELEFKHLAFKNVSNWMS